MSIRDWTPPRASPASSFVTVADSRPRASRTIPTTGFAAAPIALPTPAATGAALANYTLSYAQGTFTILKKPATVTAVSSTKVYGTTDPALVSTTTDFTASDAKAITLAAKRVDGEAAGTYQIAATPTRPSANSPKRCGRTPATTWRTPCWHYPRLRVRCSLTCRDAESLLEAK